MQQKQYIKIFLVLLSMIALFVKANTIQEVDIAVVLLDNRITKKLSNIDEKPKDLGISGGLLGIKDNNTTGMFANKKFNTIGFRLTNINKAENKVIELINQGYQHIVLDVPTTLLTRLSDNNQNVMFYNVGNKDEVLRNTECRKNIINISPSYSMLSDALVQFLVQKKWDKLFLITGKYPNDKKFADAIRKSSKKFGAKIVAEKNWEFGPDSRRTAQKEIPVFTQNIDYDMLIVADEIGEFGEYLLYQTWRPLLVAGTQGLVPTSWHKTHEKWGAAQLQSRFLKTYKRNMRALDYQVWAAMRGIGEAVIRTNSNNFNKIKKYIFTDQFGVAGFKGVKLTLRSWNNQLRQPILLASSNSLVSVSPQKKFLHQFSNLDTMGTSKERSLCRF